MEMFLNAAQLKMVHVPYQGGGPAFNALLSEQVPVVPTLESIGKGQIDAGNIRILAQWGTKRLPSFPHAPTLQEAGYPEVIYILWAGVFAPKKTPAHVTQILRDAIRPFMQDRAVVDRFVNAGSQVSYLDGPEFTQFLRPTRSACSRWCARSACHSGASGKLGLLPSPPDILPKERGERNQEARLATTNIRMSRPSCSDRAALA